MNNRYLSFFLTMKVLHDKNLKWKYNNLGIGSPFYSIIFNKKSRICIHI